MRSSLLPLLVCAAAVAPASARAIGACEFPASDHRSLAFRRQPLPANARFLAGGPAVDRASVLLELVDVERAELLAFTLVEAGDTRGALWVVPSAPLPAGVRIRISYRNATGEDVGQYDIGSAMDTTPSAAPTVEWDPGGDPGACCENIGANVSLRNGLDDDGTTPAVVQLLLESSRGSRRVLSPYAPGTWLSIGGAAEGCIDTDPLAQDGEEVQVTVTLLDWAGNESPPVGPTSVVYSSSVERPGEADAGKPAEPSEPSGCSASSGRPAASAAVLVGLALLRCRRRAKAKRVSSGRSRQLVAAGVLLLSGVACGSEVDGTPQDGAAPSCPPNAIYVQIDAAPGWYCAVVCTAAQNECGASGCDLVHHYCNPPVAD